MKLISILLLSLFVSCASDPRRNLVVNQPPVAIEKKEAVKIKARAMASWMQRYERSELENALNLFEQLSRTTAADRDVYRYLAQGYYFLGDYYEENLDIKKTMWEKGMAFGEKALMTNPAFRQSVANGSTMEESLPLLSKEDVASLYWTLANIGKWVQNSGRWTQMKYEVRIKEFLGGVEHLDPQFYHGAVSRYWGAFYAGAPRFFGRDLRKSKNYFKTSLKVAPYYLGTKVLMAEVLYTQTGDLKEFKNALEDVVKTPADINKNVVTENLIAKQKAKRLLKQVDELF